MKTFGQLQNEVARNLSATNATYKDTQIRDFLNATYEEIWEHEDWPGLLSIGTATVTANTNTFILAKKQYRALRLYNGTTNPLISRALPLFQDQTLNTGLTDWQDDVAPLGDVGVATDLDSAQIPKVVSSSANDITAVIFLKGATATGSVQTDSVTVTGTTPVAFAKTFATIESVSKGANTVGIISLTNNAGTGTLATLDPQEVSPRYGKYKLGWTPASDTDITLVQKRRFLPFLHTYDTPIFDMDEALRLGAEYRGWKEARQYDTANLLRGLFMDELARLVAREITNDGSIETLTPIGRV